ncbi:MAG: Stp1/IreP family PP2C-type Ser/Thr phosphatase [bacterium]|nr:Stp1/IreP family PP2C-type Ser/Thr phosphatase [bacterium]
MELYFSSLSDVGNLRNNNEDFLYAGKIKKDTYLFIVADGMGGHNAGDVASYTAVTSFVKAIKKGVAKDTLKFLERTVLDVNHLIMTEGKKDDNEKGMGTTFSALYICCNRGYIVHVGDSRVYRFSDDGLEQLTEDHSLVGKLLKEGFITKKEAQHHPKRNVLYQSVGLKSEIKVQAIGPLAIKKGERFLLCSDGLNGDVSDEEIAECYNFDSTREIVDTLVERTKSGVASDNITVIAVSTYCNEVQTLDDTVKIPEQVAPIPLKVRKKRKKKIGLIALLILMIILLMVLIFIIARDALSSEISIQSITNDLPSAFDCLLPLLFTKG